MSLKAGLKLGFTSLKVHVTDGNTLMACGTVGLGLAIAGRNKGEIIEGMMNAYVGISTVDTFRVIDGVNRKS